MAGCSGEISTEDQQKSEEEMTEKEKKDRDQYEIMEASWHVL